MTLAGIELAYLIKEIGEKTEGCYVNNIYGINRNSLLFKLRHPDKPDVMLMISSIGMWTTSKKIEPIEPNKPNDYIVMYTEYGDIIAEAILQYNLTRDWF